MNNYGKKSIRSEGVITRAIETSRSRMSFVLLGLSLCFVMIAFRLVELSIAGDVAVKRHITLVQSKNVEVKRDSIIDRNGILLATNLKTASLYANPKVVLDPVEATEKLQGVFPDINSDTILRRLSSGKGFVWIKRHLTPKEQFAVNDLGLPGLYFREEEKRTYPHGKLASHILGMVGTDGHGLSGIEKEFDEKLMPDLWKPNDSGSPLQLSIDMRVQDVLRRELYEEYKAHNAKAAAGVVMDANSGEILALVSLPDFDPNFPSKVENKFTFNHATLGVYEMGSTFKAFTMAMALDANIIALSDVYDARKPIRISRFTIRDHHGKSRIMSVPEIFIHSSNIGTAKIADDIGADIQKKFLGKLGLLDRLDIELSEISTPLYPDRWGRISTMTVSYGHGISVTPLHVASATSAIVNGGILNSPSLIKGGNGYDAKRVMKAKTSETMRKLLRLVVTDGTVRNADAKGYLVGGKTGTAEKAGSSGKYQAKKMVSSFTSAFPMDNPKYVVLAVIDEPKGNKKSYGYATAGYTAAPVVKNVIKRIAPILGVKPVDETLPEYEKMFYVDYTPKFKDNAGLELAAF